MSDLESSIEELESVKSSFKGKLTAKDISTSDIEFRSYPQLLDQMEKILPSQTKTITPTTSEQSVTADSGYKLTKVEVGAVVPSDYYKPEESVTIEPTTNTQVVNPPDGSVFNVINVNPVTSDIDSNIKEENIKEGVTILGKTGSLKEGIPIDVSSDSDMENALIQDNLGKVYKFTGTSETYETDAVYIVSEV